MSYEPLSNEKFGQIIRQLAESATLADSQAFELAKSASNLTIFQGNREQAISLGKTKGAIFARARIALAILTGGVNATGQRNLAKSVLKTDKPGKKALDQARLAWSSLTSQCTSLSALLKLVPAPKAALTTAPLSAWLKAATREGASWAGPEKARIRACIDALARILQED